MPGIVQVEGVGEAYALKLKTAGVSTTKALLSRGATPQGRKQLAAATGIDETLILEWVNHVDLYQKIIKVNTAKNLVRRLPTAKQVTDRVREAKSLPRMISY